MNFVVVIFLNLFTFQDGHLVTRRVIHLAQQCTPVAQRDAQDTLFTGPLKNPKWIFIITHYTGGTFPQPLLWDHLSHGSQTDGILKFSELPFNQIISSKLNLTKYIFAKFYRRPGRDHHLTTFQNLV